MGWAEKELRDFRKFRVVTEIGGVCGIYKLRARDLTHAATRAEKKWGSQGERVVAVALEEFASRVERDRRLYKA